MFRRVVWCALTALVLSLTAASARATPCSSRGSAPETATNYSVYYRKADTVAWSEHRSYRTASEATAAVRQFHDRGFEVQVHAWIKMTHAPAPPQTSALPIDETVTYSQAAQVFRWLAGQHDIAFGYPSDGCYARAHLMIRRMQTRGVTPFKVWSFQNGDPLYVRTPNLPAGHVEWRYHIAPLLRVRFDNGRQRWYVIDPALFHGPVTITKWRNAQRKPGSPYTPYVTLTRLGQSPRDPHGVKMPGSGYWPGPDPREGLASHAVKTMRQYKPYEGRTPPRALAAGFNRPPWEALAFRLAYATTNRRRQLVAA